MDESVVRVCCERFRLTTVVVLLLEVAILVLFGVFVRYDDQLGMPYQPTTQGPNLTSSSTRKMSLSTSLHYASNLSTVVSQTPSPLSPSSSLPVVNYSMANETGNATITATPSGAMTNNPTAALQQVEPNSSPATTVEQIEAEVNQELSIEEKNAHVNHYYPAFQDIHVMMFVGFGFLMTFLKRYGFSSVGFNFFVAAFVLQWATLTAGWILHFDYKTHTIYVNVETLINADFAAAAVLISFGAVLGKISSLQLIVMALIEIVAYQANELFVFNFLKATDTGDSMVVHTFGAYFGLAVAWINCRKETEEAEEKDGSVYHSDLFAMIGTLFLWLFWPSFNCATAVDEGRLRAIVNTYYSLTASTVVTFAISALVNKDKFSMVHIQNSTLAGGVAVGTLADLIIQPWGAILVGSVAGVVSVLGYRYLTPFMSKRLKLHDTCGVHNLHGMPGLISGIGSILAAGLATKELYGDGLNKIFMAEPPRTTGQLAGYQAAATFVSLFMGLVCGAITGVILRIPIWNRPNENELFDDEQAWLIPSEERYDVSANGKPMEYVQTRGDRNDIELPGVHDKNETHT